MGSIRVKRKLYVLPALAAVGSKAVTALNVAGAGMAAKDIGSAVLGSGDEQETSYNPQNVALATPSTNTYSAVGTAAEFGKAAGKGLWNFAKNNKGLMIGGTAASVGITAGLNKLSNPSTNSNNTQQNNEPKKTDSNTAIAGKAIGAGAGVMAGKYAYDSVTSGSKINKLVQENERLTSMNNTVSNAKLKNVTTNNANRLKQIAENEKKIANLKSSTSRLGKAGKWGAIAAGVTATGLAAKKYLIDKPNYEASQQSQHQYSTASFAAKRLLVKAGQHGAKTAAASGATKAGMFDVAKQLGTNAWNNVMAGNFGQAAKQTGAAIGNVAAKAGNGAMSFMTGGKDREIYSSLTKSLRNSNNETVSKLGNTLTRHDKLGKVAIGGALSYGAFEGTNRLGSAVDNKIIKPVSDDNNNQNQIQ